MEISYLTDAASSRLLLIYAGWSTDASAFASLTCPGYDIAVAWNYSELTAPALKRNYDEVVLIAWSLGVKAAELTAGALPLTLTMAVNGTPTPVSDVAGIPEAIYRATADELTEQSLAKFRRRMGASGLPRGARTVESLRNELLAFPTGGPAPFRWDRAVISDNDRIFPPANQEAAWNGRTEIVRIPGPHMPDFQNLIDRFVIDKSLVSCRFAKGRRTYNDAADVQHRIADHLFALWQKHGITARSVIEIGVGNGYFTDLYAPALKDAELTLWDIAPARPGVVGVDAECALPQLDAKVDAIVSASTMQWFNSAGAFLDAAARALNPGGLAVLSTFGPQTFNELTRAGVVPLPYLSAESLRRIAGSGFDILECHEGLIKKLFDTPLDVFAHMKATGVNARRSTLPLRSLLDAYPRRDDGRCSLTYQPVYLILRKK